MKQYDVFFPEFVNPHLRRSYQSMIRYIRNKNIRHKKAETWDTVRPVLNTLSYKRYKFTKV